MLFLLLPFCRLALAPVTNYNARAFKERAGFGQESTKCP